MTDPVLRDEILAAFFQGPDVAVEVICEMLATAWDRGVEARKHNAQVAVEKSQGHLTVPEMTNPYRPQRADVVVRQMHVTNGKRVRIIDDDQGTGEKTVVGEFGYTQDDQGQGTFAPIESAEHGPESGRTQDFNDYPVSGDVVGRTGPDGEMVIEEYEEPSSDASTTALGTGATEPPVALVRFVHDDGRVCTRRPSTGRGDAWDGTWEAIVREPHGRESTGMISCGRDHGHIPWWSEEDDPYDKPVQVQGHSHSEPACAWPACTTYLTREQMAEFQKKS